MIKGTNWRPNWAAAAIYCKTDVSSEGDVAAAIDQAVKKFGSINVVVNSAGIATAGKTISKKGPADLKHFELAIKVNLVGTFNVITACGDENVGERPQQRERAGRYRQHGIGRAFDGQIGQAGYAASKSGVVGMTLPIARDLASYGIRNVTIAPGIFDTPMMASFSEEVRNSLGQSVPFPQRLGRPDEFAGHGDARD